MSTGTRKQETGGATPRDWWRTEDLVMAAAALAFLAAYAYPVLRTELSASTRNLCEVIVYVTWAMFAVDYGARLIAAENSFRFFRSNLLDLLSIALPVLRPLRLLRLFALVRVLNRTATVSLRGRVALYIAASVVLIVFVGSVAILEAERGKPGANITSFGEAIWWAAATVTTVGYGDLFPVTGQGRFVAAGLMVAGIALVGALTASFATWLIERVRDVESDAERQLHQRFDELQAELAQLRLMLSSDRESPAETGG